MSRKVFCIISSIMISVGFIACAPLERCVAEETSIETETEADEFGNIPQIPERKKFELPKVDEKTETVAAPVAPGAAEKADADQAQASDEPKREVVQKELSGEIAGISSTFLAVVYGSDPKSGAAREMALTINKDTLIERKGNLQELGIGDTVSVKYEETSETVDKTARVMARTVKVITFMSPALKEFQSQ